MQRVQVSPDVIDWVFKRTGKSPEHHEAPQWIKDAAKWKAADSPPTLKQLIDFARKAHVPIDYLFAPKPPSPAQLPLPDMRTVESEEIAEPSLELLEVVHLCQWRQEWYKDYLSRVSNLHCAFVGSASLQDSESEIASNMRNLLTLGSISAQGRKWEEQLKELTRKAEEIGVLVMRMSMIRSPHRKLDPAEFRGFALADDKAPLVFINGADGIGAQAFTFAHEFAHLMLGETALSGSRRPTEDHHEIEKWCNQVAAEFLVPATDFQEQYDPARELDDQIPDLANRYKVSSLVILIRLKTLGHIGNQAFQQRYDAEKKRIAAWLANRGGGGKGTTRSRQINEASASLCRAAISSIREGTLTFRQACDLLNVTKTSALEDIGHRLGM